ncbi:GntR family transcriptional regulator [Sphaerisporangium siamense]|uniref:DNA-binding GntR family transcriptional regulator n=1 Tax=Sphaerisporangium siamense TaxID=795645 RepID=A0A7W7GBJ1_9ACTN|nr:GntR family transcriptional regulator [Sphaerisporangium siamense]MBB4702880.1 DNA-binding GntR family transcriptional regulator [Sphaerisporangium siamense]GII83361.1 GntR family transcriptional regulator [Sphaerisporangium siamense]
MPIERRPLREQIREELLLRLDRGDFAAGTDVNEAALAAELGVSRTPLREALITLAGEGVLESNQGRGFRFAPVSRKEFRELCAIVAALEALALETSDADHLRAIAPELLRMAREFPDAVAEQQVIERHDDEWHDLLLSGCPNERLLDLITSVKAGMRRYAHLLAGDDAPLEREAAEHRRIAELLQAGELPGAIGALRDNWVNGMERMMARIPE